MSEPGSDRLRAAAPAFDDVEARRARAGVAAALFGPVEAGPEPAAAEPGVDPGSAASERVSVGRYEIRSRLGAGGMGVVYRAHDPDLDRPVAVKLVHHDVERDAKARARMLREARALAKLSHPNVITVYDVGTEGDQVFVAMELVAGRDLRRWLASHPRAGWREVLGLFVAAGQGLAAAHEAALIHRDFKPDNVLVGDDGRVRVLDFGLARTHREVDGPTEAAGPAGAAGPGRADADASMTSLRLSAGLTETGAMLGTPLYMAPELYAGRPADERSDQFAFCASVYEGLYRQLPFGARTLAAHVDAVTAGRIAAPPPDSPVPPAAFELLARGLRADPLARHGDMRSLLAALERAAADATTEPSGAGGSTGVKPRLLGLGLGIAALLAVAGILAAGLGWFAAEPPVEPAPVPVPERSSHGPGEPPSQPGPVPAAIPSEAAPAPIQPAAAPTDTAATADMASTADPNRTTGAGDPSTADPSTREPERSGWCHLHEDHFTLLARTASRRGQLRADGQCYVCRVERRASRTRNFSPRDCAGYSLCGPAPAQDCP